MQEVLCFRQCWCRTRHRCHWLRSLWCFRLWNSRSGGNFGSLWCFSSFIASLVFWGGWCGWCCCTILGCTSRRCSRSRWSIVRRNTCRATHESDRQQAKQNPNQSGHDGDACKDVTGLVCRMHFDHPSHQRHQPSRPLCLVALNQQDQKIELNANNVPNTIP